MRVLVFALIMMFSIGTAFAEPPLAQRVCAHFGKSAMLISIHKIMGDSMEKQLAVLTEMNIQDSEAGKVLANIIKLVYSPEQTVQTKDDVSRMGMKVYDSCMALPKQ